MKQALVVAVRGLIKDGMDLFAPTIARSVEVPPVALPAGLATKAAIYSTRKEPGLNKVALATRSGRAEAEVRRILDPDHGTKLGQVEEAAAALGGRLAVAFVSAGTLELHAADACGAAEQHRSECRLRLILRKAVDLKRGPNANALWYWDYDAGPPAITCVAETWILTKDGRRRRVGENGFAR